LLPQHGCAPETIRHALNPVGLLSEVLRLAAGDSQ
jgi:hypothetical protein